MGWDGMGWDGIGDVDLFGGGMRGVGFMFYVYVYVGWI